MGAIPYAGGVTFRVWAPNATALSVHGSFDDWDQVGEPLAAEEGGTWSADISGVKAGDEYRFIVRNGDEVLSRIDPRARRLTNSVGNASWWLARSPWPWYCWWRLGSWSGRCSRFSASTLASRDRTRSR